MSIHYSGSKCLYSERHILCRIHWLCIICNQTFMFHSEIKIQNDLRMDGKGSASKWFYYTVDNKKRKNTVRFFEWSEISIKENLKIKSLLYNIHSSVFPMELWSGSCHVIRISRKCFLKCHIDFKLATTWAYTRQNIFQLSTYLQVGLLLF